MTSPVGAKDRGGDRYYTVNGIDMPSASTITKVLHKPGLEIWKQKAIALAVATNKGLQRLALDGDTYKAARQALDAMPSDAADLGTAVHLATELWDADDRAALCEHLADVRPRWGDAVAEHLGQWTTARKEYGIEPVHIERTVCHMHLEYAGTMDRAVTFGHWTADAIHPGCTLPHILDVKTGKEIWPDVALQLAMYAHGTHLLKYEDDQLVIDRPLDNLCQTVGVVASLHADRCVIVPVDLTDAWVAVVAVRDVFHWEQVKKAALGKALVPVTTRRPW